MAVQTETPKVPSNYKIVNGIQYRLDDTYAFCARCGGRPVINDKCPYCDVVAITLTAQHVAKLMKTCMETHTNRKSGYEHTTFNLEKASRFIQMCIDQDGKLVLTQATNQGETQ